MYEHPSIRMEIARQRYADVLREARLDHLEVLEIRRRRANMLARLRSFLSQRQSEQTAPRPSVKPS